MTPTLARSQQRVAEDLRLIDAIPVCVEEAAKRIGDDAVRAFFAGYGVEQDMALAA